MTTKNRTAIAALVAVAALFLFAALAWVALGPPRWRDRGEHDATAGAWTERPSSTRAPSEPKGARSPRHDPVAAIDRALARGSQSSTALGEPEPTERTSRATDAGPGLRVVAEILARLDRACHAGREDEANRLFAELVAYLGADAEARALVFGLLQEPDALTERGRALIAHGLLTTSDREQAREVYELLARQEKEAHETAATGWYELASKVDDPSYAAEICRRLRDLPDELLTDPAVAADVEWLALEAADAAIRAAAAFRLARDPNGDVTEMLQSIYDEDADPLVRIAAARALSIRGDAAIAEWLVARIDENTAPAVVRFAAAGLGRHEPTPDTTRVLASLARAHPDPVARTRALGSLSAHATSDAEARQILLELAHEALHAPWSRAARERFEGSGDG